MKQRKLLSLLLALVLVLSMLPAAVFAADTITVYATVSNRGEIAVEEGGVPVANVPVTVEAEDGKATVDAVLRALHESYGKEYVCKGYVTTCWSVPSSNCLFFVNDKGLSTGVTVDTMQDGDRLTVSINADDATYADWYTFFDQSAVTVKTGQMLTLTLKGYQGMMPTTPKAISGAQVRVSGLSNNLMTDKNGAVSLSFDEPGVYCVSAVGTVQDTVTDWNLMDLGNNTGVYGTMDFTTYDSFVAYTEKDYGNGPYPAEEVQYLDFFEWNEMGADEKATYHILHSNQLIKDCPIIAPVCVVTAEYVDRTPITVYATVSDRGQIAMESGVPVANVPVTVAAEDGTATVDAALKALHALYEKEYVCKGYVTTCWSENTSNCLFFVNDQGIKTGVTVDTVQSGDRLTVSINADDETYADYFSAFDHASLTVKMGVPFSLTLEGFPGMMPTTPAPIADAELELATESGFVSLNQTTDADGKATLMFDQTGTYVVTASGTVSGTVTDWNLMDLGNNTGVYGTIDWTTYDSFVAYTEKDYGNGPYPAEEVQYLDFFEWNEMGADEKADYHILHSNQLMKDCPIIAPVCVVTVQSGSYGGGGAVVTPPNTLNVTFRLVGAKQATQDVDLTKNSYLPEYVTWIPTTAYTLPQNSTVYDLLMLALSGAGLRQEGAQQGYVETIYAPADLGGYPLSEFTNGTYSGWMYTVNGRHSGNGLQNQPLRNGDAVVWHYVSDYRCEVADLVGDAAHPSLGDGTYYNGWLKVQDSLGNFAVLPDAQKDETKTDGQTAAFSDVSSAHWAFDAIEYITKQGIMDGVGSGKFAPETPLTRAMLVTVLHRMAGSPATENASSFTDVAANSWYAQATAWASANGIVNGVGGGKFAPMAALSREQLAAMLMRFAAYQQKSTDKRAELSAFSDAGSVSAWARDAVAWANAEGLMSGRTATTIAPQGNTTRAELAAILMRYTK